MLHKIRHELCKVFLGIFITLSWTSSSSQQWPMWAGPNGNWIADERETGLLRDMSKASLLWKSEESDIGPGRSQSPRYNRNNLKRDPSSGWVSPIIYEGFLYQHYWVPKPGLYAAKAYDWVSKPEDVLSPEDSAMARRHFAILCTEYLVKIDINNGKTVWKKVLNDSGAYYSDSKPRGGNNTPSAGDGRIYTVGTLGQMVAIDTADGEVLWQRAPISFYVEELKEAIGEREQPRVFRGYPLVFKEGILYQMEDDKLEAINPENGEQLWKKSNVVGHKAWIQFYQAEGKTLLVTATNDGNAYAMDSKTGSLIWELSGLGNNERGPIINEGYMLLNGDSSYIEDGIGRLFCYKLKGLDPPELLWESDCYHRSVVMPPLIYKGNAYLKPWRCKACDEKDDVPKCGHYNMVIYDLETGAVLADLDDGPTGPDGFQIGADGLVVSQIDGSHAPGRGLQIYDTNNPVKLSTFEHEYPPTTAYTTPLVFPIVQGKLFVRGHFIENQPGEGTYIYCYNISGSTGIDHSEIQAPLPQRKQSPRYFDIKSRQIPVVQDEKASGMPNGIYFKKEPGQKSYGENKFRPERD